MRYVVAKNSQEAVTLLGESGRGRLLAGGTDLLVQMKSGGVKPDIIIDIKRIEGLSDVVDEGDGAFTIGAAVSGAAMGEHPALGAAWPGVVEAMGLIGSTQVQGRATMAGNLCNGSPAADSVPALLAAGAMVQIIGPEGVRESPVAALLRGPGQTTLGGAEMVTAIKLPPRPARAADAYLRFIPRSEMDIAVASAGVNLTLSESGEVVAAQVALGAVAPTARLVPDAAAALLGTRLEPPALAALASACAAACAPITDKRGTAEFRTRIAGVMATRAAKIAYTRAGGSL